MTKTWPVIILCVATFAHADTTEVSFTTSDGVTVFGDIYRGDDIPVNAPLILLFHQGGGDSRGEYTPLVSRLLDSGYNLLAIDQRRGGDRFGGVNRTLERAGDSGYGYCDAMPDLEAALDFARAEGFTGRIAAWGSSYSAALVFKLAADHPGELDAVVAFSPASGEPMAGCNPEAYSDAVTQPVLALRPAREMEVPYVPGQMALFREHGHRTYVADPGVHGSSMLVADRVGAPTDDTWAVVLQFLEEALAP
jgi:alpha-beta hydrolase superfamily lysophospholipase